MKNNKKKIVIIIAVILLLAIAACSGAYIITNKKSTKKTPFEPYTTDNAPVFLVYSIKDEKNYAVSNSQKYEISNSYSAPSYSTLGTNHSTNGSALLVFSGEDGSFGEIGALHLATSKGVVEISDSTFDQAVISSNAKTVVYLNSRDVLMSYDTETKAQSIIAQYGYRPAVSPDGSTVAYISDDDSICIYNGEKTVSAVPKGRPIAVSNGGDVLYYELKHSELEGELHAYKSTGEDIVLAEKSVTKSLSYTIEAISRNSSELIYTYKDKTFISVDAAEGKELLANAGGISDITTYSIIETEDDTGYTESYANSFILDSGNRIWYIDAQYKATQVSTGADNVILAEDKSSLYYTNTEDTLIRLDAKEFTTEEIKKKVDAFTYIAGKGDIYYTDTNSTLYYLEEGKKEVSVAENVTHTFPRPDSFYYGVQSKKSTDSYDLYTVCDEKTSMIISGVFE